MRLPLSLLVFCAQWQWSYSAALEGRDNITVPAPVVATPSEHWEGNDGTWSTFEIRVGTPPTVHRVLPATSWQETWVIWGITNACNTSLGVPADCGEVRGALFEGTKSTTWHDEGGFTLGLNNHLGYEGVANYGFDTVGLGYTNDTGVTLPHQIVAEIQSDQYWFGLFGLGFQPTNFSDYGNPQPSFSDTLNTNKTISSKSWSYTAGAFYRLKKVYGSLIFGGYDAARFTPNDVVFTMGTDNLRDLLINVRAITSTTSAGNTTLMSDVQTFYIDSAVPDLWLPVDVCQKFEQAFGLHLDNASGRYLLNSTTHDKLKSLNPNITFTLADQKTGGSTIDIVLPYASFDLNLSAPFVNTSTSYFPLRQAKNDSMYTIGRVFLQEAYVTADYNTRTFNVSQCIFDDKAGSHVLVIPSDMPTPKSGSNGTSGASGGSSNGGNGSAGSGSNGSDPGSPRLSSGAIAGIVIGTTTVLVIIGGIFFCCFRGLFCFSSRREKRDMTEVHEIDSGKRIDPTASAYAAQASAMTSEVPGQDAKVEIAGNPIMHPQELEAEVPMSALNNPITQRVSGPSSSSGKTTDISSLSQSPADRTRQLFGTGRRAQNGPEAGPSSEEEELVSPASPVAARGLFHREGDRPGITVTSPADTNATWSPQTPVVHGSRFEERWS